MPNGGICQAYSSGVYPANIEAKGRTVADIGTKRASLYRMVMPGHTCPYGLKALDLLQRQGFEVEDHWLTTRDETDAFKAKHGVKTTPQTAIGTNAVHGNPVTSQSAPQMIGTMTATV